jgi:alkylation response protein AidB-like acyl-CoA dehydrogenase
MRAARPAKTASLPTPAARAEAIGPVLAAAAAGHVKARELAPHVLDALHEARLFRLLLPRPFGGEEITPPEFFHAMRALARFDASTAWCVCQGNGCAMAAAYVEPAVAREIWGRSQRAVMSWGPPASSRADMVEGGYRASGKWTFASGCRHSSWIGLHCPVFDPSGQPVRLPGAAAWRTLFVPREQVRFLDVWDVVGLCGTGSDSFEADSVIVPTTHAPCRDEAEERHYEAPLYLFPAMLLFAIGFSGVALGIARGMLDDFLTFAKEKSPRGVKSPIRDNALVQHEVAEAEARLRAADLLVEVTAERAWGEVVRDSRLTAGQRMDIRLATTHAIHEAKRVADAVYDAAGSSAIFNNGAFARRFRDIHTVTQQLQGRRAHLQTVGAFLLGLPADTTFA